AYAGSLPSHSGMSDHGSTPAASSFSPSTQTISASESATARQRSSSSDIVSGDAGPTAFQRPHARRSAMSSTHAARSRTSITCVRAVPSPGASTRPPSAIRAGQYVNRSVGSSGPTIRPGRIRSARSPNTRSTARSHSPFNGPYVSSVISSTDSSAIVATGPSGSLPDTPLPSYTDTLDTNV